MWRKVYESTWDRNDVIEREITRELHRKDKKKTKKTDEIES